MANWSITETLNGSNFLHLSLDAEEMLTEAGFLLNYFPELYGEAEIDMYDMVSHKYFKAIMSRLSNANQFVISWGQDFVNKINYTNGDEILLEPRAKILCFKINKVSALRTYPEMSSQYRFYGNC